MDIVVIFGLKILFIKLQFRMCQHRRRKLLTDNMSSSEVQSSPYSPDMRVLVKNYSQQSSYKQMGGVSIAIPNSKEGEVDQTLSSEYTLAKVEPRKFKSKSNISSRLESVAFV
jgi:hypothetical protein